MFQEYLGADVKGGQPENARIARTARAAHYTRMPSQERAGRLKGPKNEKWASNHADDAGLLRSTNIISIVGVPFFSAQDGLGASFEKGGVGEGPLESRRSDDAGSAARIAKLWPHRWSEHKWALSDVGCVAG